MLVATRSAAKEDVPVLVEMYRRLEDEMASLHPMWPLTDGLSEPIEDAFLAALDEPDAQLLVGEVEGQTFGFLYARVERMLPQADGQRVGSIRLIYTDFEAREVGVAEAMRDRAVDSFRKLGITRFDAHVLPGHRLAKNFFEAGGFSARSIIMHRDDNRTPRPGRDPRRF